MPELSVLIPARNEEWLARTVADVLEHCELDTEVIAVIDGERAGERPAPHPRLRLIELAAPIGQRAAQNLAAEKSTAHYVMKLDAHCAMDQGFDRKLLAVMQDDIVIVPQMRNLHVFDWVCGFCGAYVYQGPRPAVCAECQAGGEHIHKKIIWNPKHNPSSSAYRFNKALRFKYFPELRNLQGQTGLQETMSLQGSCFMAAREFYWERELCDQTWGNWGQQGSEVALKTWLSGARVMCCMDTWYAHLFRTQPGFSFPYSGIGASQEHARQICQEIFLNDAWPKQIYPLAWLLERFWTALQRVGDYEERWEQADLDRLKARPFTIRGTGQIYHREPTKGIIYYTDNELDESIARLVQERIVSISRNQQLPITTAALKHKLKWGAKNLYFPSLKRGELAMLKQILGALENSTADIIFFCEHDTLYDPSHFAFVPLRADTFYYNVNVVHVRWPDGYAVAWDDCQQVSGLCAYRELLIDYYRQRVAQVEREGFNRHYEPGLKQSVGGQKVENWKSEMPNLDIRHNGNLTRSKWSVDDFRNKQYAAGFRELAQAPGWDRIMA